MVKIHCGAKERRDEMSAAEKAEAESDGSIV